MWLKSDDVVKALIDFAHDKGVTKLIVGRTHQSRWRRWLKGDVPARLVAGRTRPRRGNRRDRGTGGIAMNAPSLQRRIRNGTADAGVGRPAGALHAAAGVHARRRNPRDALSQLRQYRGRARHACGARRHSSSRNTTAKPRTFCRGARQLLCMDRRRESRLHRGWRSPNSPPISPGAATSCSTDIAAAPPGAARSRIRRTERPPRRSDRDEQGRDVPRRQPLGKVGRRTSPTISPAALRSCCWSAPRSRGASDGGSRSR